MMKEAEEKKREVRRHIAKMRRMFKQLLEQNDTLPTHLRLHKDVSQLLPLPVYFLQFLQDLHTLDVL